MITNETGEPGFLADVVIVKQNVSQFCLLNVICLKMI